VEVDILGKITG